FLSIVLGQCLSLLICGTAVTSGLLQSMSVNVPTAQSLACFCCLTLIFNIWNIKLVGLAGYNDIFRNRTLKYMFLGILEVEANYFIIKAYHYTSVTSVQILDCLTTPTVLLLSKVILKRSFKWSNYLGVVICLVGAGLLVLSDVLTGNHEKSELSYNLSQSWKGNLLCILGAVLYGVSNICQEAIVCKHGSIEYLAMISYFASIVSGVQFAVFERHDFLKVDFSLLFISLPFAFFALCLVVFYSLMSYAIHKTSAISVNLNLLSSDFFSLLAGIFLFHYKFHPLYFASFSLIIFGVVMYNLQSVKSHYEEEAASMSAVVTKEANEIVLEETN
ncbi:hypothetical protein HELRODRAFT_66737, partial [Helobdella robusta]|uniref:Sugar phosphate transporter domain-containing protein n=1 Tax=Helobdella robusta TaxID=6412 RepID=T1FYQ1_HELRO